VVESTGTDRFGADNIGADGIGHGCSSTGRVAACKAALNAQLLSAVSVPGAESAQAQCAGGTITSQPPKGSKVAALHASLGAQLAATMVAPGCTSACQREVGVEAGGETAVAPTSSHSSTIGASPYMPVTLVRQTSNSEAAVPCMPRPFVRQPSHSQPLIKQVDVDAPVSAVLSRPRRAVRKRGKPRRTDQADSDEDDLPELPTFSSSRQLFADVEREEHSALTAALSHSLVGRTVDYVSPTGESCSDSKVVRLEPIEANPQNGRPRQISLTLLVRGEEVVVTPEEAGPLVAPLVGAQLAASFAAGPTVASNGSIAFVDASKRNGMGGEGVGNGGKESGSSNANCSEEDERPRLASLAMNALTPTELAALDFRVRAAMHVVKGSSLTKFIMGRSKRHKRMFRVLGSSGTLTWGSHAGVILRAEHTPFPGERDGFSRLQREHKLEDEEKCRCFQVVLHERDLFLMAPSLEEKQMWVAGINALLSGLYF